jgi:hypothetical protein
MERNKDFPVTIVSTILLLRGKQKHSKRSDKGLLFHAAKIMLKTG